VTRDPREPATGLTPASSRSIYHGRLLDVRVESWPAGEREVVRHPGACAVVALTPAGEVILVRQFREAVRSSLLEIPAGIRDVDGEDGSTCAARELLEETGHEAWSVTPLASILTSPGFADERIDLFVAEASAAPIAAPAEQGVQAVLMPFGDAVEAASDGTIVDGKSVAALLLAERWASTGRTGLPGILYRT
jgi:8-oxo-dGTP pyrophosphatase MutT (NUDIX family)